MRLLIIAGTRPEIIKCAPLYLFAKSHQVDVIFCNTGQHQEMAKQALDIFDIQPDINLNIMSVNQSINDISLQLFKKLPVVIDDTKPDFVIVQGDTSTAAISSMIAFNMKCRVVHLEAGLRTYNNKEPYPEEINRRIIGTICDVHLCPTIRNYNNLKSERIQTQIEVVGNTIIDALQFIKSKYNLELPKTILQHLSNSKYILVTAHRRESFGKGILNICHAILRLSELYPSIDFVYPVHPNPNVKTVVNEKLSGKKNIILLEPVDYITMLSIINNSLLCMSDSGGIQEEAPSFNKFTVVLRNFSERMESVECGYSFLVGTEPQAIIDKVTELLNSANFEEKLINPYGDGQASQRIISLLQKISPE